MNLAGYVTRPAVRTMETVPFSIGWRKTSKASTRNSGSSSRNSTPLCAKLNSPGIGIPCPPPAMPAALVVWCGARTGRICDRAARLPSPIME